MIGGGRSPESPALFAFRFVTPDERRSPARHFWGSRSSVSLTLVVTRHATLSARSRSAKAQGRDGDARAHNRETFRYIIYYDTDDRRSGAPAASSTGVGVGIRYVFLACSIRQTQNILQPVQGTRAAGTEERHQPFHTQDDVLHSHELAREAASGRCRRRFLSDVTTGA